MDWAGLDDADYPTNFAFFETRRVEPLVAALASIDNSMAVATTRA